MHFAGKKAFFYHDQEFQTKFDVEIKADELKRLNELSKLANNADGLEMTFSSICIKWNSGQYTNLRFNSSGSSTLRI
jgi:hypothetical protein